MLISDVKKIKREGQRLGRAGLSQRVIALVAEFDGSYKGAMKLAGRMRVIAAAASQDDYWREQVGKGEWAEMNDIYNFQPSPQEET